MRQNAVSFLIPALHLLGEKAGEDSEGWEDCGIKTGRISGSLL
jgi:hypothetical protein